MSLPEDFWEQLPRKTDAELYDMLVHQDDYLPEALAAAKEELQKRNLKPERAIELEAVAQTQRAAEDAKAGLRLGWPMRILIFLLCSGLFGAPLAVYYSSKGFKRKASDCWFTMSASIGVHILLFGLRVLLSSGRR